MNNNNQHIPQGYKSSPLGIIPEDWEVKRLECAFHLQGGFAFKSEEYKNSGIPIIRISNLPQNGKFVDISDCVYSDRQDIAQQFHLRCDDLLIAMSGATTGKVAIYNNNNIGYLNQRVGLFQHTSSIITYQYLYFLVTSDMYSNQLTPLLIAGAQPNIAPSDIENLKFPVPPLPEQQRIVSVLQLWDTAISKQTQLVEKLTLRKRGLMQQLLTGKKRLKGFEGEWKRIKAGELFKSTSVRGNKNEALLSATQEYGVIPRDQLEGRVTMPTGNLESFKLVEIGDFVISLRSFQGGIEYSNYRGNVSPAYTVLKPKIEIDKSFYRFYFKSSDFIGHLAIAVIGIRDGKQICYEDFCFVKIPYPPIEEQNAIATILIQADKEIEIQKQKLARLQEQKKGLMQVLLTGKRRVK